MVIEGVFHRARYAEAFGQADESVVLELYMTAEEKSLLQTALINRTGDILQLIVPTPGGNKPTTEKDHW